MEKWMKMADESEGKMVWFGITNCIMSDVDVRDYAKGKLDTTDLVNVKALEAFRMALVMLERFPMRRGEKKESAVNRKNLYLLMDKDFARECILAMYCVMRIYMYRIPPTQRPEMRPIMKRAALAKAVPALRAAKASFREKAAAKPLLARDQGELWLDYIEKLHSRDDLSDEFLRRHADAKGAGEEYSQYDEAASSEEEEEEGELATGKKSSDDKAEKKNKKKKDKEKKKKNNKKKISAKGY
ncbi:Hypothetical Protein FCC1311_112112 [Hondaea fermentalgiana]|uniref:Uncharacterized protein n=1 Tax=Hondaea fermentalgiana TaxID=2315210 RepID=A0A2R5GXD2_9STRA|nr:Hypothetical Protein FCC1311_112112 [Hondaea fermentalgiana]|eukprot:GBG34989.1 Hypothetical Protein FCC1311_112112 [Hondaea fermentalgiana]